ENLLKHGNDEQLAWVNPARSDDIETVDVRIALEAPGNTRRLSNVDPARHARHERSSEELRNRYLERAAAGELRWVLSAYPGGAAVSAREAKRGSPSSRATPSSTRRVAG